MQSNLLARLLLIQNMAMLMESWETLSGFVCRGLEEFPGVQSARYEETSIEAEEPERQLVIPLHSGENDYGAIIMEVDDRPAIDLYLPYIQNMVGMIAVILDNREQTEHLKAEIESRKDAETKLRKLTSAVEQSPSAVVITDLRGVIEYVNPRFLQMTGYSPSQTVGRNISLLQSGETPEETYEDLWRTINAGHRWQGDLKDKRRDGSTFWASVSISPVWDEKGEISNFVAMHEDITKRKNAEQKVRKAMGVAQSANKAKSELLANMSHELRTPLNAIIGFSDTIRSEIFGPIGSARYADYNSHIFDSAQHLLELINDILDVSAIEAGKVELHEERLSVYEVMENCYRLIEPRAAQGKVCVSKALPDGLPPFVGDERRIKQSLINLLSNAVKFTPEGGLVTLVAGLLPDGGLELSVVDTGVGMGKKGKEKAMTQFGQVDSGLNRKHEGTGLGLPLVKGLVELHGGRFVLDSKPGKGTTARILLPPSRVLAPAE